MYLNLIFFNLSNSYYWRGYNGLKTKINIEPFSWKVKIYDSV